MNENSPLRLLSGGLLLLLLVALVPLSLKVFENLNADQIMVVQSPIKGTLNWYTSAGVKWQGFGKVTTYPKRSYYQFEVPVRFNDGGHGTMHGSIQYEMPLDVENLTKLHVRFGSADAVQKQLVEQVTTKAVYMTGPLMSSKESFAEKRNNLLEYVENQISHGVYKTLQKEARTKDPMTGADKTVTVVEIVTKNGVPERQEEAVLSQFGLRPFNFTITRLPYDEEVEKQIKQQQSLAMEVQTAIAAAKQAEQRAITAAKEGEANAAKAKWEQEVVKAKEVTFAQQRLEVAQLEARAAEQTKRKDILLGEGEAERKRLVMAADGALDPKLQTWLKAQQAYADAIKGYTGNWVPTVVMGGNTHTAGSGANQLVDLLTTKTALDLGLDLSVPGANRTKGKQ